MFTKKPTKGTVFPGQHLTEPHFQSLDIFLEKNSQIQIYVFFYI